MQVVPRSEQYRLVLQPYGSDREALGYGTAYRLHHHNLTAVEALELRWRGWQQPRGDPGRYPARLVCCRPRPDAITTAGHAAAPRPTAPGPGRRGRTTPPVAMPGRNNAVNVGQTVQLDGSASTDPKEILLTYAGRCHPARGQHGGAHECRDGAIRLSGLTRRAPTWSN